MAKFEPGIVPQEWVAAINDRYPLYLTLHELLQQGKCSRSRCQSTWGAFMRGCPYTWRVVGITRDALENFREPLSWRQLKSEGKFHRGHLVARRDTAKAIFDQARPLKVAKLADLQWRNDMTVICLKSENNETSLVEKALPFDEPSWELFASQQGLKIGHREEEFLKKFAEAQLDSGTSTPGAGATRIGHNLHPLVAPGLTQS